MRTVGAVKKLVGATALLSTLATGGVMAAASDAGAASSLTCTAAVGNTCTQYRDLSTGFVYAWSTTLGRWVALKNIGGIYTELYAQTTSGWTFLGYFLRSGQFVPANSGIGVLPVGVNWRQSLLSWAWNVTQGVPNFFR